jgi:hypothetical protein
MIRFEPFEGKKGIESLDRLLIKWVFEVSSRSVVIPAKAGIQEKRWVRETSGSRIKSGMTKRGVRQQSVKRLKPPLTKSEDDNYEEKLYRCVPVVLWVSCVCCDAGC